MAAGLQKRLRFNSDERLKTFFKDHNRSVDSAIGRVENIRLEDGKLKADVVFGTDEDAEKVFRKYGKIDSVINCAAILTKKELVDMSFEDINKEINTNFLTSSFEAPNMNINNILNF